MYRMLILFQAGCLMLLASCNAEFHRKWAEAGKTTPAGHSFEGRWEGTWNSLGTGHSGKLRCVVGPATTPEGDHPFAYRATWKTFLSGSFAATHRVQRNGNSVKFHGTHAMPTWAGGIYTYDGTVKNGSFEAAYRCAKDHGTFQMTRPSSVR